MYCMKIKMKIKEYCAYVFATQAPGAKALTAAARTVVVAVAVSVTMAVAAAMVVVTVPTSRPSSGAQVFLF